ncbi:MAG: FkbM family methyltransferase [Terracidiphilus sp.]
MPTLRALAKRLSQGRSFRIRLPKEYGACRMFVTPEAGLAYWFPKSAIRRESLLRNAAETIKRGNVVWDAGANMGLFSLAAAGLSGPAGRVFAFEPDTDMVKLIRRSARLNPDAAPVEVVPCAISDTNSLARFNIANNNRAASFLEGFGTGLTGGAREVQTVLTVSLDWLAERIPPPDVLKIDVEGAELYVFRGAARLLKAKRPVVLFESQGGNWGEISRGLWDLGYTLYNCDLPPAERKPLASPVFNTLALPA